jgi:hypothetical protein
MPISYVSSNISLSLFLSVFADLLLAGRFVNVSGIRETAVPQY